MKITGIRCRTVAVRESQTAAGPTMHADRLWPVAVVLVQTDQGVEGIGFAFTLGGLGAALLAVLQELAELTVNEDPTTPEVILAKIRRAVGVGADSGLALLAQAAIDMALWDMRGKMAGLPLWRLVGGARAQVPGYSSGGVGRHLSDDQAAAAAARIAADGFSWIKMHLALPGDGSPRRELERARRVREAVGPDIRLGCDINGNWSVGEAIDIGRRLADVGFAWIEDPIRHDDYHGMARVTAALDAKVMAGESNWGPAPFRLMLEARSVDILMIDVMTVGGITAWLKIAAMAEIFNISVVSHLLPEVQAHLVAGVPNGLLAEHKAWLWDLFEEVPIFDKGKFHLSERPGLGLALNKWVMERF